MQSLQQKTQEEELFLQVQSLWHAGIPQSQQLLESIPPFERGQRRRQEKKRQRTSIKIPLTVKRQKAKIRKEK